MARSRRGGRALAVAATTGPAVQVVAAPFRLSGELAQLALIGAMALVALPSLWLALRDHSMFWYDEVLQSLEQGHRLAFGPGLVPWEYRDGARSWLLAGIYAGVFKLGALLGIDSAEPLVGLVKTFTVGLGVLAALLAALLARRLCGQSAAVLTGLLHAALPALIVFRHRAFSETVCAPALIGAVLLVQGSGRWRLRLAGVLLGLAVFLRYQNGLLLVAVAVLLLASRRWDDLVHYAQGALATVLAGGLLDWATWGIAFQSFFVYVDFNLVRDGASGFGTAPVGYYARTLFTSCGPGIVVVGIGFLAGARRASALALTAAVFVLLHCAIPHKELRFILPIMPLVLCISAIGLVSLLGLQRWRRLALVSAALVPLLGAYTPGLTYHKLGQYNGSSFGALPIWAWQSGANELLMNASRRPELCGIIVTTGHFGGTYTYLHRDVPMMWTYSEETLRAANFVLAFAEYPVVPGYQPVARRERFRLDRRSGGCAPPPRGYDRTYPNANRTGLWPPDGR